MSVNRRYLKNVKYKFNYDLGNLKFTYCNLLDDRYISSNKIFR